MKRGGEDNASAAADQRLTAVSIRINAVNSTGCFRRTWIKYREDTERRSTYYPDKSESLYKRYVISALQLVIDTNGKIPNKKEKTEASWGERG